MTRSWMWTVTLAALAVWLGPLACGSDDDGWAGTGGAGGSGGSGTGGTGTGGSGGGAGGGPWLESPGCSAYQDSHELYFVSPEGDDSWTGRHPEHQGGTDGPWRTIGQANASLQAGEAVCVLAGTYPEIIEPHQSGTEDATLVYTIYGDGEVLITGEPGKAHLVVIGRGYDGPNGADSYVVVDGFKLWHNDPTHMEHDEWLGAIPTPMPVLVHHQDSAHNVIRYLQIECQGEPTWDGGATERAIKINKAHHNVVEHNLIHGMCALGIITGDNASFNTIRGNTVLNVFGNNITFSSTNGQMQNNLVEDNVLCGSVVSDGIQFEHDTSLPETDYDSNRGVVVRGNIICDSGENSIDLKGAAYVVIENNVMYSAIGNNNGGLEPGVGDIRYPGAHSIMHGTGAGSRDVIIRGNVIYDGNGGILPESGYKLYNNTIVYNNRDYTGSNSDWVTTSKPAFTGLSAWNGLDGVAVKNNIFGGHFSADIAVGAAPTDLDINHNLYFNDGAAKLVEFREKGDWEVLTFAAWQAFLAGAGGVTGADADSLEADPLFVNVPPGLVGPPDQFDFHVQSGSPCIDAGAFLTTTVAAGSGTSLAVVDGGYFFDGYGIVEGDTIQLEGQTETARITAIDYDTDVLTLDTSLTWEVGIGVALPYQDGAPDIGAFE